MAEFDPRKTVTHQLVEIRTVLTRSRTALHDLERNDKMMLDDGGWDFSVKPAKYIPGTRVQHPQLDEMKQALRDVINALEPFERRSKGKV